MYKRQDYYYNIARGIDERPVKARRVRKSIGAETTFEHNLLDKATIWQALQQLTARVEASMQKRELVARTVTLKVRYSDFTLNTRSKTLIDAVVSGEDITQVLPELLKRTEVGRQPIRLVGVSLSNLGPRADFGNVDAKTDTIGHQLGLF